MSVYAICQHKECGGKRRHKCFEQTAHKRFIGWVADWKPSRAEKRIRETFSFQLENPKKLAEDKLSTWKTDRKRGAMGFIKTMPTLFGALAEKYWIEHAAVEGRDAERTTRYLVDKWKEWIGTDRKVSPLTDEELVAFQNDLRALQRQLKSQGLTGATINRQFNIGRSICERGREWGIIKVNPFEFVNRVQEDEPAPRFLEQNEIDSLFDAATHLKEWDGKPSNPDRIKRLLTFMRVISHTGARPSSIEECSFDNGDVDFNGRIVWFTTYKGGRHKKKHRYPVPIDDELWPTILERAEAMGRKGLVFDCRDMFKLCTLAINQSKINDGKPAHMHFTMYGLKHCLASHLLMNGASLFDVAKLFGHTDTRMLEKHYGHLTMNHLRKVQSRVNLTQQPAQLKVV